MNRIAFLITLVVLGVSHAFGGGSVSFCEQILPILKQDETFADALITCFDFRESGFAQSDFGNHTRFAGKRLGPYTVLAKPKGSQSGWIFEVTINTKWIITDAEGRVISLRDKNGKMTGMFDDNATRIEERFESLLVRPWTENEPPADQH